MSDHPKRRSTDRNFWTQTGGIPRWQRLAAWLCVIAAAGYGITVNNNLGHRIQEQRFDATRANCEDVNSRHERAQDFIDRTHRLSPPAKAFVRDYTNLALPKRPDCTGYAKSLVRPSK